jgi:chromosome segregation ATPase
MPILTTIAIASAADYLVPLGVAAGSSAVTSALWWWGGKPKKNTQSNSETRLKALSNKQKSRREHRQQQAEEVLAANNLHAISLATQTDEIVTNITASTQKLSNTTTKLDEAAIELMSLPELFSALSGSCETELVPIIRELQCRLDALSQSEETLLNQNQTLGEKISQFEHSLETSRATTQTLEYSVSENKDVVKTLNQQLARLSEELKTVSELPHDDEEKQRLRSQNSVLAQKLAEFSEKGTFRAKCLNCKK